MFFMDFLIRTINYNIVYVDHHEFPQVGGQNLFH